MRGAAPSSRVAEVPAEITFRQGQQRRVVGAQGQPVHVGPGLGTVAGVEVVRHPLCPGDPGEEQLEDKRLDGAPATNINEAMNTRAPVNVWTPNWPPVQGVTLL